MQFEEHKGRRQGLVDLHPPTPLGRRLISGTAIGAVDGDFICDPGRLGLDVNLPVFFLALLAEELRAGMRAVVVALIAAPLALALVPFTIPACRWFGPLFDTGDRSEHTRSREPGAG